MKERMFLIASEGNHMTYGKVINGEYFELQVVDDGIQEGLQGRMDYAPLYCICDEQKENRESLRDVVGYEYNYLIIELFDNNESKIIKTWSGENDSADSYYCDEFAELRE